MTDCLRPPHFITVDGNLSHLYSILEINGSQVIHSGGVCDATRVQLYAIFPEHVAWHLMKRYPRKTLVRFLELHGLSNKTQERRLVCAYLQNEVFMQQVQTSCGAHTADLISDPEQFAKDVIWWIGFELTNKAVVAAA